MLFKKSCKSFGRQIVCVEEHSSNNNLSVIVDIIVLCVAVLSWWICWGWTGNTSCSSLADYINHNHAHFLIKSATIMLIT